MDENGKKWWQHVFDVLAKLYLVEYNLCQAVGWLIIPVQLFFGLYIGCALIDGTVFVFWRVLEVAFSIVKVAAVVAFIAAIAYAVKSIRKFIKDYDVKIG